MFLANVNREIASVALAETWLKSFNESLYSLNDNKTEHNVRTNKGGGGVSIVIKYGIEYYERPYLKIQDTHLEIQKSWPGNESSIIIGVIYIPPVYKT